MHDREDGIRLVEGALKDIGSQVRQAGGLLASAAAWFYQMVEHPHFRDAMLRAFLKNADESKDADGEGRRRLVPDPDLSFAAAQEVWKRLHSCASDARDFGRSFEWFWFSVSRYDFEKDDGEASDAGGASDARTPACLVMDLAPEERALLDGLMAATGYPSQREVIFAALRAFLYALKAVGPESSNCEE
jgi:hypothetical protein